MRLPISCEKILDMQRNHNCIIIKADKTDMTSLLELVICYSAFKLSLNAAHFF